MIKEQKVTLQDELDKTMQDQHIVSSYDRDLQEIQSNLMKMGGLVEAAIINSAKAFSERDLELADQVRQDDRKVDILETQVNEDCARLIARRAPMASDLRLVLSVIKISGALERIGDYAKSIAKRTAVLAESKRISGAEETILNMVGEVEGMLNNVLTAHMTHDENLAEIVRNNDKTIDETYNVLFRDMLNYMIEDENNIPPCMHLHFISKNVERIGDHITNIAEQVIYNVTGELPDENRPKSSINYLDN